MFHWAFQTAEGAVNRAVNFSAPLVNRFDRPISYFDQTLLRGIEKVEVNAPIIKEPAHEIYNQARNKVIEIVFPQITKVCDYRAAATKGIALSDIYVN